MTSDTAPTTSSSTTTSEPEPLESIVVDTDFDIIDAAEPRIAKPVVTTAPPASPVAPPLPVVPVEPSAGVDVNAEHARVFLDRVEALKKEARAVAAENADGAVAAAPLWFEAGRLYEHELANHREAAVNYQESHRADPTYVPVIHAARRLFGQLGKWGMVAMLIDEELRLPGAPIAMLLIEKARIHDAKLARPEDAVAIYKQVLAHEAENPIAVDAVVRALSARGAFADVVDVLVAAAAAAKRDGLKAAWLLEAARLCETRLNDDARALGYVEEADRYIPNRRPVLEMLRRLYARRGDQQRLADVLEKLADNASTGVEAVTFLSERARIESAVDTDLDGLRRAVAALEEARARAPQDTTVLAELARLYEALEMWPSLADCIEARALSATDRRERLAFTADAARLAEERLGEVERAIRLYRACVELDPADQTALSALGRLFAKTKRFEELSHIYDVQHEGTVDAQQKIPLLFKHAELLATQLDDVDNALLRLRQILELSPGYAPASKLAASLYTKLGRHKELVEIWQAELQHNVDKDQGLFLLEKIADTLENQLLDLDGAVDAWQRMLKLQAGHLPALRSLGRLYAQQERWEDLLKVNLEEAQSVSDQNVVVSLWFRNGEVLADKLGRVDDAIDAFNRALQLMPTYLPALKALGGIYARAGRFIDLVAMHRAEAEVARRAEQRAQLLFITAELLENKVHDVDGAVRTYKEVLEEDASHLPARRALKRIATKKNDATMLFELLSGELGVVSDARERAILRCTIAELLERRLDRVDDAIAMLEAAIKDAPSLLRAHESLASLLSRHNRASDEAAARERLQGVLPDADGRVANLRAVVDLYLHRLDDPARALDGARRLLQLVPTDRPALRSCLGCALRLRDWKTAITAATSLAQLEPSADEVCNLYLQIATWREGHVEPAEDPLPDYVRMLEFSPQHPIALRAVERLYVERRAWHALFALYEREGLAITEPRLVVDNAMKMGELAENRLNRPDVARACYERAFAAKRDHLPAISRLKELYGKEGRPQDQLRLLTLEAQTSKDPAHAIRTLLEVGALQRDKFGDVDAAIDCFSRVLDRDPLHAQALPALEALLVGASRWQELASLYERRADALPADAATQPQRIELLFRAAHLAGERLQNPAEAIRLYERVIQTAPTHTSALLHLGNLSFSSGDWDKAIAAYGALLPIAGDPMLLVPVHFNLGVIFVEHRFDAVRAVQHLTTGLAMQPENRGARQLLARAYGLAGSPAQSLQTYRQLLDSAVDVGERKEVNLIMARIYESAPDAGLAAAHYEAAMQLTDDKAEAGRLLDQVAGLYERAGNLQGLVDSTSRQAEALVASNPRRAADLHFRNANLALEKLNNLDLALRSGRRALELAPDVVDFRGFVADLYSRVPNQQLLAVEEHRRVLRAGRIRVGSLKALYRGFAQQRAHDRAFCAAELLSFVAAADDGEELFFADNKKRVKKESTETLDLAQMTAWLAHPSQRNPVREVLAICAPDLGKIPAVEDLEPIDKKFVLRNKAADPLRTIADNMAVNLGALSGFDVWRSQQKKAGVEALAGSPSILLVGLDVTRTHPNREQRFLIGRKLMALASGHHLVRGLDARAFGLLLTAIGRSVDKAFPALAVVDGAEIDGMTRKVNSALSRKAKALLAIPLQELAAAPRAVDLATHLAANVLTENRAGLVLAGAFDAAARLVARDTNTALAGDTSAMIAALEGNAQLADLVAFALSDEHFQARQALKLAIDT